MLDQKRRSTIAFSILSLLLFVGSLYFSREIKNTIQVISFAQEVISLVTTQPKEVSVATSASESSKKMILSSGDATSSAEKIASESAVMVTKISDGDTITIETGEKVRYIGIDTPELHQPYVGAQCYGQEAMEANTLLVLGKQVRLEKDTSETDKYGRLLRYVWVDGEMVNETLVAKGFAFAKDYPPDSQYKKRFAAAQAQAQAAGLGMWAKCQPQ